MILERVAAARSPAKRARWERELDGPEYPDSVAYLEPIARRLHGRSGASMNGAAPVSEETIAAYCAREGITLSSLEVEGLILIDAALINPSAFTESDDDDEWKPMKPPPKVRKGRADG